MHARSWNRCLGQDAEAGACCRHRPTDGIFCPSHALEFRLDEAAKAATRLARARLALDDPTGTPLRQWWAALQIRRSLSIRRSLLAKVAASEVGDTELVRMPGVVPGDEAQNRR
jgi:hypothetical protein